MEGLKCSKDLILVAVLARSSAIRPVKEIAPIQSFDDFDAAEHVFSSRKAHTLDRTLANPL